MGSDHVLYLVRGSDGQLETNACNGSHAGPPDPYELGFFGSATSTATSSPAAGALTPAEVGRRTDDIIVRHMVANLLPWLLPAAGLLGAVLLVVLLIFLRRGASRRHARPIEDVQ